MSARGAAPLRLVSVAFGATALLIVLQTVIYQLLPYDSQAIGRVALALRVAFWAADATMVVAFVVLARAAPTERALLRAGTTLAGFAVLSGLLGLGASALGEEARALREMSGATSSAEPVVSLGTALVATLALGALASGHGSKVVAAARALTIAVVVSALLSLGSRLWQMAATVPRSLTAAWASWIVEVTRPALVAVLALLVARAMARTTEDPAPHEGPYRAAGGAPSTAPKEPLDAPTRAALGNAARGLSLYRVAFLIRVAAAVGTMGFALLVVMAARADSAMIFVGPVPLASLGTAVVLAFGLLKVLALPRGVRARGVTIGALVALGVVGLLDVATLAYGLYRLVDTYAYRASRDFIEAVFAVAPLVALASGVSLLFVASALRRLGDKLGDELVAGRARGVQGLAIAAGSAQLAAFLAAVSAGTRHGSSAAGGVVVLGLVLAALAATVVLVILHVLLVSAAHALLVREVSEAPRAG